MNWHIRNHMGHEFIHEFGSSNLLARLQMFRPAEDAKQGSCDWFLRAIEICKYKHQPHSMSWSSSSFHTHANLKIYKN